MKQTSIPALAAALAAVLGAALGAPVHAQGTSSTQIPDCVLQCRPWFIEQVTIDCETDCLAYEGEIEFDLAAGGGDPYIPRFQAPGCDASSECPFGAEVFTYQHGNTVLLGAGLWSTATKFWLGDGGGVVQAEFFIAPVSSVIGVSDMADLEWKQLPQPHFDSATGFWQCAWPTSGYNDPAGYFLRVDMLDSLLGTINAFTMGVDPNGCGFHPYGELIGGANQLELTGQGETCPGKTAKFEIDAAGTGASEVFTALTIDGDYLPLSIGTVLIGLVPPPINFPAPVVGGQAAFEIQFPSSPLPPGVRLYLQSLAIDSGAPTGFVLSNGLRIDPCPCP